MPELHMHDIHTGTPVYSADGHAEGHVTNVYTEEFEVGQQHGQHHARTYRLAGVRAATPTRIDLSFTQHDIEHGQWNQVTLKDAQGHDRPVIQVGVAPVSKLPQYDEVQTTTGGPPTGEADD